MAFIEAQRPEESGKATLPSYQKKIPNHPKKLSTVPNNQTKMVSWGYTEGLDTAEGLWVRQLPKIISHLPFLKINILFCSILTCSYFIVCYFPTRRILPYTYQFYFLIKNRTSLFKANFKHNLFRHTSEVNNNINTSTVAGILTKIVDI